MCRQCGCLAYVEQGPEAMLRQASTIIKDMGVTPSNVQLFEDGERICVIIASMVADNEIREIAQWVSDLHRDMYAKRSEAYAEAARDVFSKFPAKSSPREVITSWHQLESLCGKLGEEVISSIEDPFLKDTLEAVRQVHKDNDRRRADLLRRYNLDRL